MNRSRADHILNDLAEGIKPRATQKQLFAALRQVADQRDKLKRENSRLKTCLLGVDTLLTFHKPFN